MLELFVGYLILHLYFCNVIQHKNVIQTRHPHFCRNNNPLPFFTHKKSHKKRFGVSCNANVMVPDVCLYQILFQLTESNTNTFCNDFEIIESHS